MNAIQSSATLFIFWIALTGSAGLPDLVTGAVLSVLLGALSARYLWADDAPVLTFRQAGAFLLYLPHLIVTIVKSAIQVAEVVLDPHMPIDPVVVGHRTSFSREVSKVAFANSITMTPGTLTLDIEGDTFHIHCLTESFATEIASGELERRVARVFEE